MTFHRYPTATGIVACALVISSAACASYPAPTQPLADAEAADRSATELGAQSDPGARLHLELAKEQTASARKLMTDGDNKKATALLLRAKADAELAVSLAKEQRSRAAVGDAAEKANLKTLAIPANAMPVSPAADGASK